MFPVTIRAQSHGDGCHTSLTISALLASGEFLSVLHERYGADTARIYELTAKDGGCIALNSVRQGETLTFLGRQGGLVVASLIVQVLIEGNIAVLIPKGGFDILLDVKQERHD